MGYDYQEIGKVLKTARESKGLSQRALTELSGVLQARISKIESGSSDFRLSTLMALSRALDLELTLVPRKAIPAVQSVVRASEPTAALPHSAAFLKELRRLHKQLATRAPVEKTEEYARLQRSLRDLSNWSLSESQMEAFNKLRRSIEELPASDAEAARHALAGVQALRNQLAHAQGQGQPSRPDAEKPAYSLDDEDEDA